MTDGHPYLIQFEFPGAPTVYAGDYNGAAGWALHPSTARRFDTREAASRFAANAYGPSAEYALVVHEDDV